MKKRRMGVLLLSSALILSGVTFGVVSCGEGTQQTTENPQITLALDVSEIYVGQTAKVTATVNGSAVTGVEYSIVEGGEKVASVASDGTVTGLSAGKATIKARKAGHKAGTVEIYKDGKLVETLTSNTGTLAYTGNTMNIVLVVSSIAIIALGTAVIARKRLANA